MRRVTESIRVRGMRDIKTSRDIWRVRRARSMSDVRGIESSVRVREADPDEMQASLEKEKRREERLLKAVLAARRTLLSVRERLLRVKKRNEAIMEYRLRMEKQRIEQLERGAAGFSGPGVNHGEG